MNPALKNKYNIIGLPAGITKVAIPRFGEVDFSTLTIQQADEMHRLGCKQLEKIAEKPKAKATGKKVGEPDG
ncbi:MAG: hypothetical protein ACPGJS_00560 [Flammeovirgaceae bacterium]